MDSIWEDGVTDAMAFVDQEAEDADAPNRRRGDRDAENAGRSINIETLKGSHWPARTDIAEPDFMLGELLSTTARVEVIGATGRGKSHFLMAAGKAVADGRNFLHWRGCVKSRRVLYIDGEMSRRQTRKRLIDAARRHGGMPSSFFCLNRDDFPELQPPQ
jgi:predicted ATP-dependent serine protease